MCVDEKPCSRNIEDHDLGSVLILMICFDNVSAMMMQYRFSFPFHIPLCTIWGARLQTALVHLPLFCILHLSFVVSMIHRSCDRECKVLQLPERTAVDVILAGLFRGTFYYQQVEIRHPCSSPLDSCHQEPHLPPSPCL